MLNITKKHSWKVDRNFRWTQWLEKHKDKNIVMDPELTGDVAFEILCRYLLLEDKIFSRKTEYYEYFNATMISNILLKYSKKYRKEFKAWKKLKNR